MTAPATQTAEPIAKALARFVAGLRYEDLPAETVAHAKKLVLDQLACELIGSTMPWVQPALQFVRLTEGVAGESTIVNDGSRFLAADAAFVNATFGQACELDDSAFGSAGHIGTATVPVALAMGERERIDGRRFITATVAGYEVMYRMMRAVRPFHNDRGFHGQGIGGPFAGAAVAGKILGLGAEQLVNALAIAGSHAGGPLEYDQSGGEVKRIHAGIAARGGIHSALLAGLGLTGPATIIEGRRGFFNIFSTRSDPSGIVPGLGEVFNIGKAVFKMYPAIGGHHTAIAAVEKLVHQHDFGAADIDQIRVGIPEKGLLHGAGIKRPKDVVGAQFSLAFSLALAAVKRSNELEHYMDSSLWSAPDIVAVADRVTPYVYGDAQGDHSHRAAVTVILKDGRTLEATENFIKGSPKNPASDEEMAQKVRRLSGKVLTGRQADQLVDYVAHLEKASDVSDLAKLLTRRN